MKFKYSVEYNPDASHEPPRRRPMLGVKLLGKERSVNCDLGQIDSGADASLFRMDYAKRAGIDLRQPKEVQITGIGNQIRGFETSVDVEVEQLGKVHLPRVWFVDSPFVNVLLGQEGFFDSFRIKFARDVWSFELTPVKKKRLPKS